MPRALSTPPRSNRIDDCLYSYYCPSFVEFGVVTIYPSPDFIMAPALLTAVDATSHIHLIVGSNPLAGARCARSIEVGAKPILLAPEDSTLHYGLVKRIEAGEVKWLKRSFKDDDLTTLGREEVDSVVDAVFVTAGGKHTSGRCHERISRIPSNSPQQHTSRVFAGDYVYQSTSPMRRTSAHSPSSLHTPMALCRLASQHLERDANSLQG